jgi:hypothetical protein
MIKLEDNTIEVENKNYNGTYITLDDLEKVNKKVGADIDSITSKIDNYVLSDIFNADMQEMLSIIEELKDRAENIPVVEEKIDMSTNEIRIYGSTFTYLPKIFDYSKVEHIGLKIQNFPNLEKIEYLDTSNAISFYNLFLNCPNLKEINKLECGKLDDGFDLTNVTLTKVGGFNNNKHTFSVKLNLDYDTKENIFNVTNFLFDFVENGITPQTGEGICNIYVNRDFFDSSNQDIQLEIADTIYIGQRKGWFVNVQSY